MVHQQTVDKIREMKLYGMLKALEEQGSEPGVRDLSFEERLAMLVEREWLMRQDRQLARRLKKAKMKLQASMEDIDYQAPRGLERALMRTLATGDWVREHQCVIITGPTGIGKSYLACALANKACREGFSAYYARLPRLLHELSIARGDGSYLKVLSRLARFDVLVLDDWGLTPLGDLERRDVLEILEDRCETRSTIVTSQLPTEKWYECLVEPTVADAIMDRLIHRSYKIKLKGPTMRGAKKVKK